VTEDGGAHRQSLLLPWRQPTGVGHQDVFCFFPAKKCPSCPSCPAPVLPSCLEDGIGYREKCFYFVEDEADWNRSQSSCLSLGAHLAAVDTREELVNDQSPRKRCVGGFWEADLGFPRRVCREDSYDTCFPPLPAAFPLALRESLALLGRSPKGRLRTLEMVQRVSLQQPVRPGVFWRT